MFLTCSIKLDIVGKIPILLIAGEIVRVSEKGQITIPKNMRELAGILPNSEVRLLLEGNRVIIEGVDSEADAARQQRMERFLLDLKKLEGTGTQDINADDVMKATRDR